MSPVTAMPELLVQLKREKTNAELVQVIGASEVGNRKLEVGNRKIGNRDRR